MAALTGLSAPPVRAAIGETAAAEMKAADGRSHGRIEMIETAAGVMFKLKLQGLPPGSHGLHVTETGACTGEGFTSAGGIHNPLGAKHGFLNEEGPMAGNLPNIHAAASGGVEAELLGPFLTIAKDTEAGLLDSDGSAIVVLERPDDYESEPDGNTGARIACGVIVRTTPP